MAGEIKINDVSIATESGGTVTLGNATLGSTVVLGTNASPIASNLVLAAGNGIDFSAASGSAAGSSSAVLDDYEEGTFSAGLGSNSYGTFVGNFTQSEQEGYYIKIGSQVTCWIHGKVTIAGALGGGQFLHIFGLPFTGKNTTYATSSGSAEVNFVGTSVEFIFLSFPDNSTTVVTGYSLPSTGTGQNFIVQACLTYTVL